MQVGALIDEAGVLLREDDTVFFRREAGGRYRLDMRRSDDDPVGQPVRLRGVYVGDDLVDVTDITPA